MYKYTFIIIIIKNKKTDRPFQTQKAIPDFTALAVKKTTTFFSHYKTWLKFDTYNMRGGLLFWPLPLCRVCEALASEPNPAVDEPESYSDGVHDHFTLGSLFVLLLQELQTPVQLDNLSA